MWTARRRQGEGWEEGEEGEEGETRASARWWGGEGGLRSAGACRRCCAPATYTLAPARAGDRGVAAVPPSSPPSPSSPAGSALGGRRASCARRAILRCAVSATARMSSASALAACASFSSAARRPAPSSSTSSISRSADASACAHRPVRSPQSERLQSPLPPPPPLHPFDAEGGWRRPPRW